MCYIGDIIERDITRFLLTKQIKKCKKCGIIGKHNKRKDTKDKLQTLCVACNTKTCKEHYEENCDARLAYQKEYREENRDARLAQQKEYDSRPETKQMRNARGGRVTRPTPRFEPV